MNTRDGNVVDRSGGEEGWVWRRCWCRRKRTGSVMNRYLPPFQD